MELIATYYTLGNLWKGLLCCTATVFVYYLMHSLPFVKPPKYTVFEEYQLNHEVFFFIILGYLSAIVGRQFVNILSKVVFLRAKLKNPLLLNRWKWCFLVILFISVVQFPLKFLHFPERQVWNIMFSYSDISEATSKNSLIHYFRWSCIHIPKSGASPHNLLHHEVHHYFVVTHTASTKWNFCSNDFIRGCLRKDVWPLPKLNRAVL